MRDTAVGEGRLKSGTTVRGRQFGNCSRNGSETGAKESGWIPKQGASVRREPWKFKTHMTAHHPLADRRLMTFISCPAKFWSLLPPHTWTTQVFSIQYSQGFPKPWISLPALVACGERRGLQDSWVRQKWWSLLGFCSADGRFCLKSRSVCCFTSFKGTSPRHSLLSLTAVWWASLGFTFLPQKVFDFSSVDCSVTQKDRKIVPLKQETSQSLSVNLGAWFGEV